jgi:hypothetical protein
MLLPLLFIHRQNLKRVTKVLEANTERYIINTSSVFPYYHVKQR